MLHLQISDFCDFLHPDRNVRLQSINSSLPGYLSIYMPNRMVEKGRRQLAMRRGIFSELFVTDLLTILRPVTSARYLHL